MTSHIHHLDDLLLLARWWKRRLLRRRPHPGPQRSKLSRRVADLEARLGLRLLQRNTRHISLTPMGEQIYVHACAMAREARTAYDLAASMGDTPSGLLRITAPSALAVTLLGDLIGRYCQQHPRVRVLLDTRDQIIDLVGEGYDLAFRAQGASLTDSRLVARELAPVPLVLVAAPDLARADLRRPRDLTALPLLAHATQDSLQNWQFSHPSGERESLEFTPRSLSNNPAAVREMARAGLGIALLPHYLCAASLARGDLVALLPSWTAAPARIYAVMPARRGTPLALRRFLDFAIAELPARLG